MTLLDAKTKATLIGTIAVLLWALLALFTTAVKSIPPFELVSLCFMVATVFSALWISRKGGGAFRALRQPVGAWILSVGGLFGYHFFYFVALANAPAVDASLICLTIALGHQERQARDMGLHVRSEIFADRAYTAEGHLVNRSLPGAVLHDPLETAARAVRMVKQDAIETIDGKLLKTPIESICVHSDTPEAVAIARTVREALEAAGITVAPFNRKS